MAQVEGSSNMASRRLKKTVQNDEHQVLFGMLVLALTIIVTCLALWLIPP